MDGLRVEFCVFLGFAGMMELFFQGTFLVFGGAVLFLISPPASKLLSLLSVQS